MSRRALGIAGAAGGRLALAGVLDAVGTGGTVDIGATAGLAVSRKWLAPGAGGTVPIIGAALSGIVARAGGVIADLAGQAVGVVDAPTGPANGRTVIFHHGGYYYSWYWEDQIRALSEVGYRVIAKDRLGWGKSSKPDIPYSINLWASNTARLMDHLGIEQAALVGHSIGGQMVTRFAFLYPERITHLVTVNQVGLTDRRGGRGFQPLTGEVDANPDRDAVYASLLRWADGNYVKWRPDYLEHMRIRYGQRLSGDWPRMAYISRITGHMRSMDTVVNDWHHIETPTLILGGQEDYPTYAEEARTAASTFPNGEVILIPNVGHNPHEEAPDRVNAELIRFLGD